jgi:multidrug efflux system outer membrane protein
MRTSLFITCLCFLGSFSACGIGLRVGPDYERPVGEIEIADSFAHYEGDTSSLLIDVEWWKVFGDAELDSLVGEAIRNNLDIRRASAVVLEFRSRHTQARADRLPSISLKGDYQRQELPEGGVSPQYQAIRNTESYSMSIAASHELDLWGKMSVAQDAARADLLQSIENRRTVMHSVISETAALYLQQEALERRISIVDRLIETHRKSLQTVELRYQRGLASMLELKQAQRALASAQSRMPELRQELGITQHRLSLLIGRYPQSKPPRLQPEDYFGRLEPVPAGLPSDLLENRPDIRAAEAGLKALNARYGIAWTNLFPRISLTGSYGYTSTEVENLFTPENVLWSFAAGLTQPIFNAGKLLAEKNAAEARYRQGVINYAKTVLTAFAEVENALLTRREQLRRRDHIVDLLEKARAAQTIAENRYGRGLVDYLNVLDAMQARYSAEESLVLVDLAILSNRITLHRALGGNWIGLSDEEDDNE